MAEAYSNLKPGDFMHKYIYNMLRKSNFVPSTVPLSFSTKTLAGFDFTLK